MKNNLLNRIIQIAGSCSSDTASEPIEFSHELVKSLVKKLLEHGAIVVTTVGGEDKLNPNDDNSPPIIFYWDVLEAACRYAESNSFPDRAKNIIKVVSSEKSESEIPDNRKDIWNELIGRNIVSLSRIKPGWNSSTIKRQEQERLSDVLLILGGGVGVEHSAHLFISHGKPVLPFDIPLGSSCSDGVGGASYYYRLAISDPKKFIPRAKEDTASKLTYLKYGNWLNSPERYVDTILEFLGDIVEPQVFYVRLLNANEKEYPLVENFFRDVVDPVVQNLKYHIKEMGHSETTEPFINVEIFKEINISSAIVVDITGLRLNCFMEMGYAFGLNKKVILTVKEGTKLPFDLSAIPCHFWDPNLPIENQRDSFLEFWMKNINRAPLVSDINII